MRDLFKGRGAIFTSIIIITALIGGMVAVNYQPTVTLLEKATTPLSILSNDDWHDGANQSTPPVDVTYFEQYSLITNGQQECLSQYMELTYNDGSGAQIGFEIHCVFNPGGLDIANQKVLNWGDLNHIELILHSQSTMNGTWTGTMYNFQGFDIVRGNASDLNITRNYDQNTGSWYTSLNNVIGSVSYWSDAAKISAVTLSTENYTHQGSTIQQSLATFNVTIDSEISNGPSRGSSSDSVSVPTVLTFQITHNATDTEYKYGANIDWSTVKAFPTMNSLTTGQNYSMVAQDLLSFSYSGGPGTVVTQIKAFSTDRNNDSAIYFLNGTEMCRELLTTQYTIDGSSNVHNTTRIYEANSLQGDTGNSSSIYVVFDGFKYNQSTGLSFDPAVITPNSVSSSNGQNSNGLDSILPLVIVIAVIAIAGTIIVLRRRK